MNRETIQFINSKFGCRISSEYYEKYISVWSDWWRGFHKPFHRHKMTNGNEVFERDIYSLGMAKKVCEDWASILINEKTHIKFGDKKAGKFIQGEEETEGIFGENCFWTQANELVEKAFYSGTGAVTVRLDNARNDNGRLIASDNTRVKLSYISAEFIIPISSENGRITEAAFCSRHTVRGIAHTLLEVHFLENGRYVIHNYWFNSENGIFLEEKLPDGIAEVIRTQSELPWFSILTPNIENNISCSGGLGMSVLHGVTDVLKGIDLAFNNLNKDFELGGKKVFFDKGLTETLDDGTVIAPDDVGQQLFHYIPSPVSVNPASGGNPFVYEFNPSIRVNENREGIQTGLDLLSFRCGLGNKHYQFNAGTVVTATQYTGDKQDLIQNANKHYTNAERFLLSLVRSLIRIGNDYFDIGADESAKVEIMFDKSVIINEDAERMTDRQDVRDGIMAKWEYRSKWYGESEEDAKKKISEIENDMSVDMGFGDGED